MSSVNAVLGTKEFYFPFNYNVAALGGITYSQHPVTRTLRGMKNPFEIANVRVIERILYGGVSKGKINLVELANVRVNGHSSYRMLTVY